MTHDTRLQRLLWLAPSALVLAAMAHALYTATTIPRMYDRIQQSLQIESELTNVTRAIDARSTAVRRATESIVEPPSPLKPLLSQFIDISRLKDHRESKETLIDGWHLLQTEFDLSDLPLDSFDQFLHAAEQDATWRLHSLSVNATATRNGRADVVAVFRALVPPPDRKEN